MARKKHIPQGQLNKKKVVFKRLDNLMKDLGQNFSIRIGIIGDKAYQNHPHTDLTMAELGAIHEFGATIGVTDKMRGWFWHNAEVHKSNRPVIIPTRSFLRMPLLSSEGKRELNRVVNDYLTKDRELNLLEAINNKEMLKLIAELVAIKALQRVQQAFQTAGFGKWAGISNFTLSRRRSNQNPNPLEDTGDLMESITALVKSENYEQQLR